MFKKWISTAALAFALIAVSGHSPAQAADVTLRFGTGHTFWVEGDPALTLVPNTTVYYTTGADYDMYRFGGYYYINNGSTWYRSASVSGPFTRVNFQKIPREVTVVPVEYRRYEIRPNGKDPWLTRWRVVKR